jgi:septation ring formation regulator EzrA
MVNKLKTWLSDPKRDYASGLELFNLLATENLKKKYGDFLNDSKAKDTSVFQHRHNLLTSKLAQTLNAIRFNPSAFAEKLKEQSATDSDDAAEVESKINEIRELKKHVEELQEQLDSIESNLDDSDTNIEALQDELSNALAKIESLAEELKAKNVKILREEDLPANIQSARKRIKEIVPLMAKCHASLSDSGITDEQRQLLAEELCGLDDERRALWDKVDDYLNNADGIIPEVRTAPVFSEDELVRGMQIGARIKRLEENIKRGKEAIKKHTSNKKNALARKAAETVARYELELANLKQEIGGQN